MLLDGTVEQQKMLDAKIMAVAENWTIDRMSPTDRCVLRLAAFEILETDTPKSVVINEAVELAKKFGAKESQSFVNGILDKLSPDQLSLDQ
jgi:N utilization substance protein B